MLLVLSRSMLEESTTSTSNRFKILLRLMVSVQSRKDTKVLTSTTVGPSVVQTLTMLLQIADYQTSRISSKSKHSTWPKALLLVKIIWILSPSLLSIKDKRVVSRGRQAPRFLRLSLSKEDPDRMMSFCSKIQKTHPNTSSLGKQDSLTTLRCKSWVKEHMER